MWVMRVFCTNELVWKKVWKEEDLKLTWNPVSPANCLLSVFRQAQAIEPSTICCVKFLSLSLSTHFVLLAIDVFACMFYLNQRFLRTKLCFVKLLNAKCVAKHNLQSKSLLGCHLCEKKSAQISARGFLSWQAGCDRWVSKPLSEPCCSLHVTLQRIIPVQCTRMQQRGW